MLSSIGKTFKCFHFGLWGGGSLFKNRVKNYKKDIIYTLYGCGSAFSGVCKDVIVGVILYHQQAASSYPANNHINAQESVVLK